MTSAPSFRPSVSDSADHDGGAAGDVRPSSEGRPSFPSSWPSQGSRRRAASTASRSGSATASSRSETRCSVAEEASHFLDDERTRLAPAAGRVRPPQPSCRTLREARQGGTRLPWRPSPVNRNGSQSASGISASRTASGQISGPVVGALYCGRSLDETSQTAIPPQNFGATLLLLARGCRVVALSGTDKETARALRVERAGEGVPVRARQPHGARLDRLGTRAGSHPHHGLIRSGRARGCDARVEVIRRPETSRSPSCSLE